MGYAELQFILAEAAVRGWIGGNANAYYTKGISASMDFYKIGSADAAAYLAQSTIALKPNSEIEQIMDRSISLYSLIRGGEFSMTREEQGFLNLIRTEKVF